MEPMQELKHPSDRELESFLDPALGAAELERLVTHLDDCPDCEARLESIEPAFVKYAQKASEEVPAGVTSNVTDPT